VKLGPSTASKQAPTEMLRISHLDSVADEALADLHAMFDIPKHKSLPICLHHPSFRDFVLNKIKCGDRSWGEDFSWIAFNLSTIFSNVRLQKSEAIKTTQEKGQALNIAHHLLPPSRAIGSLVPLNNFRFSISIVRLVVVLT
jgi:hypothetical protein